MNSEIPSYLITRLESCPRAGEGVHNWLFKMSLQLHPFRLPEESIAILEAAVADWIAKANFRHHIFW